MTGEHVEVRATGPEQAVATVLRLLRAGGPGITGGGARGPYDRRGGDGVAYYAHLQVDVAAAAAALPADRLRAMTETLRAEADRLDAHPGGMVSAAWVASHLRFIAEHARRWPSAGEGVHITTGPPPLPAPRDLAAELVPRGDGWHVSPCTTAVCVRGRVPGLLVCCIPCRSAPDGRHGPHTDACTRRHIERAGIEAVKAGE